MPELQYGTSNFDRDWGDFPEIPVINMVVEQVPTEPNIVLMSRPGLEDAGITMGAGPVKALYQVDGVLSGALFGVSGTKLYQGTTERGTVTGTGHVSLAGYEGFIFVNAGDDVHQWNGSAFSTVAIPDSSDVIGLCVGSSRLIVIKKDTGRIYWSNVLDPTIDALSFATAENTPDNLKACLFLGDTLILFGSDTVEFWPASSVNPDLPWQPLVGRTIQIGTKDVGTACIFNGSFAWVTDRNDIRVGDASNIISNASLEEKIAASTVARIWSFMLESTEFLALTLDTETWVFSSRSSQWSKFESSGDTNWIPRCYASGYFGSKNDGDLVQWTSDHQDFSGVLERRFRAGMPIQNGATPLFNISLRANAGTTPFTVGDYATPTVQLRTSRNGGRTWTSWRDRSLGEAEDYRKPIIWRSLGFFARPSLLVEIRVTDPVPFRVSGLTANEPYKFR
jgi:hypothetical protein